MQAPQAVFSEADDGIPPMVGKLITQPDDSARAREHRPPMGNSDSPGFENPRRKPGRHLRKGSFAMNGSTWDAPRRRLRPAREHENAVNCPVIAISHPGRGHSPRANSPDFRRLPACAPGNAARHVSEFSGFAHAPSPNFPLFRVISVVRVSSCRRARRFVRLRGRRKNLFPPYRSGPSATMIFAVGSLTGSYEILFEFRTS